MDFAYPKCKNILVDVQSKPYKDEIVRYLDLISTTDVGQTVYKFIGRTNKTARITWTLGSFSLNAKTNPYSAADLKRLEQSVQKIVKERGLGEEDAFAAAFKEDAVMQAKLHGQYAKGHPIMREIEISLFKALGLHSTFLVPTEEIGTGLGIDVELEFHPAGYRQVIKNTGRIAAGFGPAEVLCHELVHALRMMEGAMLNENIQERWNMDSFEEFCSIVSANMYRSPRGFTTFTYDHRYQDEKAPWRGASKLPAALADPRRYYEAFKPQFVKWFNNQRAFCLALAESCAHFNPMAVAAADLGVAFAKC
jgi:hypothetical protein